MNRIAALALPVLLAVAAPAVRAQQPANVMPEWDRLSPAQRELLIAPLRERWNANPQMRQRMWSHAERWRTMTPEQRRQARRGMERFQGMSPQQREQARAAFERFRQLSPEQKQAMREKMRTMTPEQRRAWLQSQGAPAGH